MNTPAVPLSRRIETPDGRFAGVIAARLDPQHFLRVFSSIGADGVAVFRFDGTAILRYPEIDLVSAVRLPPTSPVMVGSQGHDRGTFFGTSPIDGVERLVAFRRIDSYRLIVTASDKIGGIRRAWLERTSLLFLLMASAVLFLAVVARLVRRQAQSAADLLTATSRARRIAERAAEAKATFLANMSHEIRTPLGGIIGYADLLLKEEQPVRQRDWTTKLRSAGEQLLAVINDILDYSKLESGNLAIEPRPVSIADTIDEVRAMMVPQADARGIGLVVSVSDNVPRWIELDPVRLKQILINLVGNAIKFTDRGAVTISTRVDEDDEAPFIRIDVIDTGIGIPRDMIASVFDRFNQVETAASKGRGGTGLGLSISRRLAELMRGSLALESTLGTGTKVQLRLPLVEASERGTRRTSRALTAKPARILLVDDLPMNIEIASAMLKAQGHDVTVAATGMEAVQNALASNFDVILLDVNLPDIDGYAVAREIRGRETGRRTPIVALTANALPEHKSAALAVGMDAHVSKPIEERTLMAQLSGILAGRGDGGEEGVSGPVSLALIDEEAAGLLRRLLGKEWLASMKASFWASWDLLEDRLCEEPPDRPRIAADMHDMCSGAGNIGYVRLAEACRDLSHRAKSEAASDLRQAVERAISTAEDTRQADPEAFLSNLFQP